MPLSLRARIAYGLGDFGQNILFQVAGIYLLSYYTDVLGISAAWAGTLFLLARIWDGINDPLMGWYAQRTRSRLGIYRPWIFWMALPLCLSFVALFWVPVSAGIHWWIGIAYILFGMCFTAVNIPYGSLTAALTRDYTERGSLTGYRMTLGMTGGVLASFAFLPAIDWLGGGISGYTRMALVLATILLVCLGITFW
ncbi:MAG: MFS transporter, partial [Bacteroidota bacterium]